MYFYPRRHPPALCIDTAQKSVNKCIKYNLGACAGGTLISFFPGELVFGKQAGFGEMQHFEPRCHAQSISRCQVFPHCMTNIAAPLVGADKVLLS